MDPFIFQTTPSSLIEGYLGVKLDSVNKYLSVKRINETYSLTAIGEIQTQSTAKSLKQRRLFLLLEGDLLSDTKLKSLSQLFILGKGEPPKSDRSSLPPLQEDVFDLHLRKIGCKEDIFDVHLHSIKHQDDERIRSKADLILAVFLHRMNGSTMENRNLELFHRRLLASALTYHRKAYFEKGAVEDEIPVALCGYAKDKEIKTITQNKPNKNAPRAGNTKNPGMEMDSLSDSLTTSTRSESPRSLLTLSSSSFLASLTHSNSLEPKKPSNVKSMIRELHPQELDYCTQCCLYKVSKTKSTEQMMKGAKAKLSTVSRQRLRKAGLLDPGIAKYLLQEDVTKCANDTLPFDTLSKDIMRTFHYVSIISRGEKVYPPSFLNDKHSFVDDYESFLIFLKVILSNITYENDPSIERILARWTSSFKECANEEEIDQNDIFSSSCESFLNSLKSTEKGSVKSKLLSVLICLSQITYTKPSIVLKYVIPIEMKCINHKLTYEFSGNSTVIFHSVSILENSDQSAQLFPALNLVVSNHLTLSATNLWESDISVEVKPVENSLTVQSENSVSTDKITLVNKTSERKRIQEHIKIPLNMLGILSDATQIY